MKKRTWLLLLALALLLMAGCSSEKTMGGTITEYLRGDTEVNAFLMEQDGKTIGVRLTGETGIYPALVDITDEALRNAEYPHMEVTVTGEKAEESSPLRMAPKCPPIPPRSLSSIASPTANR